MGAIGGVSLFFRLALNAKKAQLQFGSNIIPIGAVMPIFSHSDTEVKLKQSVSSIAL